MSTEIAVFVVTSCSDLIFILLFKELLDGYLKRYCQVFYPSKEAEKE